MPLFSLFIACGLAAAQGSIHQVDFKNFSYPLSGSTLGHSELKWLDISAKRHIHLVKGKDSSGQSGFTLNSVSFAKISGHDDEDAIVVIHYDTGGTQETDYVYIYEMSAEKPKLLAYFHTGDRASAGLHRVYGDHGNLAVELFDPKFSEGNCCSSGFVRTRYRWKDGRFEAFGAREEGRLTGR